MLTQVETGRLKTKGTERKNCTIVSEVFFSHTCEIANLKETTVHVH